MKKVLFLIIIAFAIIDVGCCQSVVNAVKCVQLDPLEKVFLEESNFVENSDTAAVAKGETATFQFVINSAYPIEGLKIDAGYLVNGKQKIAATLKAFVGYILSECRANPHSKDAFFPVSNIYPDCLQEVSSIDVSPMQNQPTWISYAIPHDAAAGNYSAKIVFTGKVNGKSIKITKKVNAKVYPVTLPDQTLWISNWFTLEGLPKMNRNQPVEPYSDRYWELLTALANVLRDHGNNAYQIRDMAYHCNPQLVGTQYSFDFTNFDKFVELLIREGNLKRILGGHLGDYHGIEVPNVGTIPFDDEIAQNFLSQYLPALYSHLKSKGWDKMYMQSIADEPIYGYIQSYIRIADFVKKLMPDIPIIDAGTTHATIDIVDVWVPLLENFHKDYHHFQQRQAAGDEVWFYTCTAPKGNYANRFLELPLIQTRFLHWINYRYGATGYLHWGFNWWHYSTTNSACADGQDWPGGDIWIVYPVEGKVYSSIRLAAMRDGIADYELLKLLEQKSPEKAKELAREVIHDFNSYNSNIHAFRVTRLKLLKLLSE